MPKTKPQDEVRERNLQALETMPEVCVFMAAYHGIRQVLSAGNRSIDSDGQASVIAVLEDTVSATYRFGILWPIMVTPRGTEYSPFFWRWFNWWYDWLILQHSPEQLEYLRGLAEQRSPDLVEWRPPGDWIAHRSRPQF